MGEPLNDNGLKFYFNFLSDGTGRIEIAEPINFDAANFVLKQDSKRYGRDVSFAGGEVDLTFSKFVEFRNLTHEFERLINYHNIYGFESDILFEIEIDGSVYVIGQLDFKDAPTDQIQQLECKVIQQNVQQNLKRREDVNVNLFSNLDVNGDPITEITPTPVFIKAKPIFQESTWRSKQPDSFRVPQNPGDTTDPFGNVNIIEVQQIKDTLSYISTRNINNTGGYIFAQNNLTNVVFNLNDFNISFNQPNVGIELIYRIGVNYSDAVDNILQTWVGNQTGVNETYNLPDIERGQRLWIYFNYTNLIPVVNATTVTMNSCEYNIQAISSSVSTITQGVRLIDAIKQVAQSTVGLPVIAPRFDVGGEFYNQFIFNGSLFRGLTDKPFNLAWKQIIDYFPEINADFEITENNEIFVGLYSDFYTNNEIASFPLAPNTTFRKNFNERYTVNKFEFKYKKFQQNNDSQTDIENSLDAVHTELQMLTPNKMVENERTIEIDFIRDPFLIEQTRVDNIATKPTSSTSLDDDIFIIDTSIESIEVTETLPLTHQIVNGTTLQLLNDGSFSWELIGVQVGDSIQLFDFNPGIYTITSITNSVIEITGGVLVFNGFALTKIEYDVTVTDIVNTTNQGFLLIEGASAPEDFSNLKFTPKRNTIKYHGSYLQTVCDYKEDGTIINTFFKYNGDLTTQLNSETESIREDQNLVVADLPDKILTANIYESEVLADFSDVNTVINGMRNQRGFIRIADNENRLVKVYPQELDFDWSRNVLTIVGEEKSEGDTLTIEKTDNIILINEVGYDQSIVNKLKFNIKDGFIQLFDVNSLSLTNKIRFDFVTVDGQTPTSAENLAELITILNES